MKELSIEEKAKAYDEAIDKVAHFIKKHIGFGCIIHPNSSEAKELFNIFPELAETNDERIRKWLIGYFQRNEVAENIKTHDIITWLEKQDEQKSADVEEINFFDDFRKTDFEDEPKFNAGDWTVSNLDGKARQISEVHFDEYNSYYVVDGKSVNLKEYDRLHHLWTIQDAKDGDVLVNQNGEMPFIFKECKNNYIYCYCGYTNHKDIFFDRFVDSEGEELHWSNLYHEQVYPATKEQCDQLEKAMAEAGYEWDAKKKELKKIEQPVVFDVPFGANDSELVEATYHIPEGFHAEISGNKVVIKKGEQKPPQWSEEDEDYINDLIKYFSQNERLENTKEDIVIWLKSLMDRVQPQPE